jgi:hypothetical protein
MKAPKQSVIANIAGIARAGTDLVVQIEHHDRRERHHRSDGQIEIAADHDEGDAERHDTKNCRGANDAHDIFGRQETFAGDREADHENHKGNQDALLGEEPANIRFATETTSHRFLPPIRKSRSATNTLLPLRNLAQTSTIPPSIMTIWPVM